MKNKLNEALYKGSAILLAATFVGSFCIKGECAAEKIEIEPTKKVSSTLASTTKTTFSKEKTSISSKKKNPNLKVGSYVKVYGRGNEASDGSGKLGYSWQGKEMMIVGIRENSEYPYACAIVDSTPGVEDVMAWFKMDVIQPETQNTVSITERTMVADKDGFIHYEVPVGYQYFSDTDLCIKTIKKYVYSDDSKEEISKKYSIPLK